MLSSVASTGSEDKNMEVFGDWNELVAEAYEKKTLTID
jgi:hypothetical protein